MTDPVQVIQLIFAAKNFCEGAIKFFDAEESINDKIISSEYNSAVRLMRQAQKINDKELQKNVLSNVIANFNKAIVLEKNHRLLMSYLGLITCYHYIGENQVAQQILSEVGNVELELPFFEKHNQITGRVIGYGIAGAVAVVVPMVGLIAGPGIVESSVEEQQKEIDEKTKAFEKLKNEILNLKI